MKRVLLFVLLLLIVLFGSFLIFFKERKGKRIEKGGEIKMEKEGKKVLFVVAPRNFRDEEYQAPRRILENAGWLVEVASKGVKEASGMFGAKAAIDKDIAEVKVDDYEGIVFVGGSGSAIYFEDQLVLSLVQSAYQKGKVVGAICIAPSILANAGILEGKDATSFPSESENLRVRGANYTGEAVTVAGRIVTGRGPEAAEEFGKKLLEVLTQ